MIRLLYRLIKKRWAVCYECEYCNMESSWASCRYYKKIKQDDCIYGDKAKETDSLCTFNNDNGVCWGFKENI